MGLKYIEPVKSIILLLLVALSVTFTFSIWTYTPRYDMAEQPLISDIPIAEKRTMDEVVKPYKMVFNFEEGLRGTSAPEDINYILNEMKKWKVSAFTLEDSNFGAEEMNSLLRRPNRLTLYFHGEVPFPVYDGVLNIEDSNVPGDSFDRLIVDWNQASNTMDLYFVSRTNNLLYSAKAKIGNYPNFNRSILAWGMELGEYTEANPNYSTFIAVPTAPVEIIQNTYLQREIETTRFRDALFSGSNTVRSNQIGATHEEFGDDHAKMSVDTENKMLEYYIPAVESHELAIPSELLLNTIDFVNEHGGWTDDFRYMAMSPKERHVKFQLFVQGLPVFSDKSGLTEIEQIWGDKRVFRYVRPYYTLELLPLESTVELPSGIDVANKLKTSSNVDFDVIEEISLGYFMTHDKDRGFFTMEPSWFYLIKGSWHRYSPDGLGGAGLGLE